ncbi:MAG: hypothetical protein MUF81_13830 [Verrucomicrobia bacterium]|nr:hypothetical protein [Verrucomicrobiota bacterium]
MKPRNTQNTRTGTGLGSVFAWFVWFAVYLNCRFENEMMLPAVLDPG